jgi:outer membrane protein assembly factor BamB
MNFIRVLFVLVFLSVFGVCFGQATVNPVTVSPVLDNNLLAKAGLEYAWQGNIALGVNESVAQMWLVEGNLYVITSSNYMYCFDRAEGISKFGIQAASSGLPVFRPEIVDGKLMQVAANMIVEIDPNIGTVFGEYNPGFTSVNRAVRQADNLFMLSADGKIYAVNYEDKIPRYKVAADDGSPITSIVAMNGSAVFATESGIVSSFNISRRTEDWKFKARGGITADLASSGEYVYVSSKDTNVYKLWIYDGSVQWTFWSGGTLTESARVGEKVVYQYVKYKGLYCIDAADGSQIWLEPKGVDILTERNDKAYIFTSDRMLEVMDNVSKKPIKSVNFSPVDKYVINSDDGKLYIADGTGKIACLKISE